jgi:hypothetical protein
MQRAALIRLCSEAHNPAMTTRIGRTIPLSGPRRLIGDLLHFARQVPSIPVQRRMNLMALRAARSRMVRPFSWCALFTKAYGLVAAEVPELRRAYMPYPYPRLYEHPWSIASIAVERGHHGENAIFFGHLSIPERQTLRFLDDRLRRFKEEPVESLGLFRRALLIGRLPRPVRRFLWSYALHWSGLRRARRMGTFAVTAYSGLGAESLHPLSPLTTTLHYGVVGTDGMVDVRIIYDHRVLDGATVARALAQLERALTREVLAEVEEQAATPDPAQWAEVGIQSLGRTTRSQPKERDQDLPEGWT